MNEDSIRRHNNIMTTGQSAYNTVADPELEISWEGGAVCALKGNASTLVDV